jgi:uncharacterized protein YndB with AHSA1/START domain
MTEVATIAPVRKSLRVECTPERAFEVFTAEVAGWWPAKTHSIHHEAVTDVVIEPREGGEMYEVAEGGKRELWGRVTTWEPPRRLVVSWAVNPDRAAPTEFEVTFTPEGDGTRVELEHRQWERAGEGAAEMRDNYDSGWELVLAPFVEKAR